jgi:hypothetical protein
MKALLTYLILTTACLLDVNSPLKSINNENINYDIEFVTMDDKGNLTADYYALLKDNTQNEALINLDKKELKCILKWFDNENKDWAANILLHIRFNKKLEGLDFYPEEIWRYSLKDKDLKYWTKIINGMNTSTNSTE